MSNDNLQGNLGDLATKPIGRLLWEYSLPAVVGMVVVSLYNVIDRIFIGQGVGGYAIAGLAITFPVMNLATAFGVLIGAGASARVSIMLGQKRHEDAARVLGNALVLTLTIATLYVSCFAYFLDDILYAFGASENTMPYARDFMQWLLPGLMLQNLTFSFNNIQRASGYPKRAMLTMLLSAGVNAVMAPIFIFALNLGIKGAAMATDIAMFSAMCFVMAHFIDKRSTVHFKRGIYALRWPIIASIISIGAAPALVNAASCLINVLINKTLLHYGGDDAVGAVGIFSTYAQLICMVVIGICQGMQPIVGYNYGAGRYERLKRTYWLAVAAASTLTLIGSIGGLTIPDLISRVFTTDANLIHASSVCLSTALMAFSIVGFQIVSTTFFQSIGKAWKSIVLSLARQVIFLIPLLLWLPPHFGVTGVWYSFPLSDLAATVITAAMIIWQLRDIDHRAKHLAPAGRL